MFRRAKYCKDKLENKPVLFWKLSNKIVIIHFDKRKINTRVIDRILGNKAMSTLYRTGFCSVSKVASVQCEQESMFCCGAWIVPKRSQCEESPIRHTICNAPVWFEEIIYQYEVLLQFLPRWKCSDLTQTVFHNLSTFNSGAEPSRTVPEQKLLRKRRS